MKFLKFSRKQTERGYEILKFLGAKRFGLRTATTGFLNFTPASRNGFEILKFTPKLSDGFEISKFALASARLADTAQNFISRNGFKILKFIQELPFALRCILSRANKVKIEAGRGCGIAEKRRAVKLNHAGGYLNSARRPIVRLYGAAARHGYEVGRAEKFSKFSLTSALLNFISLPPCNGSEILKFTSVPRKFKPASIPFLNFISNFTPPASAAKFENGVKFKDASKFKRGAR
jgi:hypothetical protein